MIVKAIKHFDGKEGFWTRGTTQEVETNRGRELIRKGLAEEVKPKAENRTTKEKAEGKTEKKTK